jgi:hypothetical protein
MREENEVVRGEIKFEEVESNEELDEAVGEEEKDEKVVRVIQVVVVVER